MPTDPAGTRSRGVARRGSRDRRIDDSQVRETGQETHHEHAVDAAGMPRDHFRFGQFREDRDVSEIRAGVPAVSHRNTHQCPRAIATIVRGSGRTFGRAGRQQVAQPGVIGAQRIEGHRDGPIRGDDVADTVNPRRFDNRSKTDGSSVDLFVDPILELRRRRRNLRPGRAGMQSRSRQRLEQLAMDAAEPAVRHHDDQIAGAVLAGDRVDDLDRSTLSRAPTCRGLRDLEPASVSTGAPLRAASTGRPGASMTSSAAANALREVVLEDPPARRCRPRLEDRPDARSRVERRGGRPASQRQPSDGARSRRTPSRRPTCRPLRAAA